MSNVFTDDQLGALSIFLEIEVCDLYKMTSKKISSKARSEAKRQKKSVFDAMLSVGAHRMLFDDESALKELSVILESK